jgi:two-component system, NtrC family, response regulator AtoC
MVVRFELLVLGEDRMKAYPLPPAGEVSIGRGPECQIRVEEPGIASLHARLLVGQTLELTDGNCGGSIVVGGRPLAPGETTVLAPSVVALLGSTTIVVEASPASSHLRHVRSHDYFAARIEEECAHAELCGGSFAILRVRFGMNQAQPLEEAFTHYLRPHDIVSMYSADEFEVLLVDTTAEDAEEFRRHLDEHVAASGWPGLQLGLACAPRDGCTLDALLCAAGVGTPASQIPTGLPVASQGFIDSLGPLLSRIAPARVSVLIMGETGVGKEALARRIHELSPRAKRPMLCLNCAALPDALLESELFGHERGAFTGAVQSKPGLLEAGQGGTVLLDEIGELPLLLQAKLLRVVEQRQVLRLGGVRPQDVDVRFIAATSRDLETEVAQGRFRQDLFFRLNAIPLVVPPLRERTAEIQPLAELFLSEFSLQAGYSTVPRLKVAALRLLQQHRWPGNVRELRNVIERAVLLSQGDDIDLEHLTLERFSRTPPTGCGSVPPIPSQPPVPTISGIPPLPYSQPPVEQQHCANGPSLPGCETPPGDLERARIQRALEVCGGNQSHAARALGISRRILIGRIERYGLPRPRKR